MTRRDYVLIAVALNMAAPSVPANAGPSATTRHDQHSRDCRYIADALAADNPRFDRARFLQACGVAS